MKAIVRPGAGESKPAEGNQVYPYILFSELFVSVFPMIMIHIDAKISFF